MRGRSRSPAGFRRPLSPRDLRRPNLQLQSRLPDWAWEVFSVFRDSGVVELRQVIQALQRLTELFQRLLRDAEAIARGRGEELRAALAAADAADSDV